MIKKYFFLATLLCSIQFCFAQVNVSGVVTSKEDGQPLPGVSVVVKGSTMGTTTDFDGKYSIQAKDGDILVFSFIGMKNQEVTVSSSTNGNTIVNIVLTSDSQVLDDVVVTALGITKKEKSLGYSVQKVGGETLANSGKSNVMDALNGQAAGVQITSSGGQAGGGTSVIIRGMTSINYNNQPLYVVDGVPINNEQVNGGGGWTGDLGTNRAADLNPDEIASVNILKGGAATALYGIRAANGAIIITTKKGKMGSNGLNINYLGAFSIDQVNKLHEMQEKFARGRAGDYANNTHWSWGPAYASNPTFPNDTKINALDENGVLYKKDVSGQKIPFYSGNYRKFWQTGSSQKHNISISGGGEKNSFFFSAGNLDQKGITPNQNYYRRSLLLNVSQNITDYFKVNAKINYLNLGGRSFRSQTGILYGLMFFQHMFNIKRPWKDVNGNRMMFSDSMVDPNWTVNEEPIDKNLNRLIGNVGFTVDVNDYLGFNFKAGIDTYEQKRLQVRPVQSVLSRNKLGDITEMRIRAKDLNLDFIARGRANIYEDLNVSYLAGLNVFNSQYDDNSQTGVDFVLRGFHHISNTVTQEVKQSRGEYMLVGFYADVTFDYNDYLFLGITRRTDWSSTLPLDNNSFSYPSVNLGFIATDFIPIEAISFMKFRASYSQTANDAPLFSLTDTYSKQDPNIGDRTRFTISNNKNNPNIRPEKTEEFEIGIDSRFFDNMISLDLGLYQKKSIDQIITQPLTEITGYQTKLVNFGEVSNKGIEISLGINNPIKIDGLNWTTNFNFTKNVSEIIRIGESTDDNLDEITTAVGYGSYPQIVAKEGEQFGAISARTYRRMDTNTRKEPTTENWEEYKNYPLWLDEEGLPQMSSKRRVIGNVQPDWVLTMNSNLRYKGVSFGFTFERKQGGDAINGFKSALVYYGLAKVTEDRFYSDSNKYANAKKVFGGVNSQGQKVTKAGKLTNDYYHNVYRKAGENTVEDASWWRLRTIYLGYTLPKDLLKPIKFIKGLNITLTGKNLFLSTPYSGNDPEISAQGVGNAFGFDDLSVPSTKSYEVSLKINF